MPKRIRTPELDRRIMDLYSSGLSSRQVAKRLGIGKATVLASLHENETGIHSFAVPESLHAKVVEMYTDGMGYKAISKEIGYPRRQVRKALVEHGIEIAEPTRDRYKIDAHAFDSLDAELPCYWLGFLYADGCVYENSLTVMLSIKDADHLKKMEQFLGTERPLYYQEHTGFGDHTSKRVNFRVRNDHLSERLRSLGIIPDRPDISLAIGSMPEANLGHFIRGYFDGDGSARKNRAGIRFAGNEDTLTWIKNILAIQAGTNPDLKLLTYKHTSKIQSIEYNGSHEAPKVVRLMYEGASVYLERKKAKIDAWPEPFTMGRDALGRICWEREGD